MAKSTSFTKYTTEYDAWFDENRPLFLSELNAVRHFMPGKGRFIEVGVGTGRFASQLGVKVGIEPSHPMGRMAQQRGIDVIAGVAEALPVLSGSFDVVLFVTTLCFFDAVEQTLGEAYRILNDEGLVVIGMIDSKSALGQKYEEKKESSPFYKDATFHSPQAICKTLSKTGFDNIHCIQTIFGKNGEQQELQPFTEGFGDGGFVVICARKTVGSE